MKSGPKGGRHVRPSIANPDRELTLDEKRLKAFFTAAPAGLAIIDAQLRYREINETLARTHGGSVEGSLGKTVSNVLPELAPTIEPILRRVLTTGHPALNFETSGKTPSQPGVIRHWVASYFPLEGADGKPDSVGAIVVEITDHKREESTIGALLRIAEKLASTQDPDALMDFLVIEAIALMQAEGGCGGLRGPEGLVCHKYFREGRAVPWEYTFPPGHGLPGWLIVDKIPYVANDARADTRVIPTVRDALGFWSAISTPVLDRHGEVVGFFEIHNKTDGSAFTPADQANLVAVSQVASVAVQNAIGYRRLEQTEDAMRQLSGRLLRLQDEERQRIARELHDTTAQDLAALVMNLDAVKKSSQKLSPAARSALREGLTLAKQASQQVRTLSYLLHPPMMNEFGLAPAIGWYVRGFSERSGIRVAVDMPPHLDRLPRDIETTIFRIMQEALINIHRHSEAKTATVRLRRQAGEIVLAVKDRGQGVPTSVMRALDTGSGDGMGVGIPGMRERAKLVAGHFTIESSRRGTTVRAILPLPAVGHHP